MSRAARQPCLVATAALDHQGRLRRNAHCLAVRHSARPVERAIVCIRTARTRAEWLLGEIAQAAFAEAIVGRVARSSQGLSRVSRACSGVFVTPAIFTALLVCQANRSAVFAVAANPVCAEFILFAGVAPLRERGDTRLIQAIVAITAVVSFFADDAADGIDLARIREVEARPFPALLPDLARLVTANDGAPIFGARLALSAAVLIAGGVEEADAVAIVLLEF